MNKEAPGWTLSGFALPYAGIIQVRFKGFSHPKIGSSGPLAWAVYYQEMSRKRQLCVMHANTERGFATLDLLALCRCWAISSADVRGHSAHQSG